ncbi:hypothetical protein [Ferruginibacter sp. SUN106]|uniref:hypothetical protein n=1 Tax=Ferruginibacter sp. SUN106 TaxID=2978348 RepID=UPI003D36A75E
MTACNNEEAAKKSIVPKSYDTLSNGLRIINRTIDSPYYYKDQVTTDSLIGNYQVYYAQNDSLYFLYLKHFDTLHLLNKTTNYTSLHYLGNVTGDDTAFFILGHDNGNGSPYSYEYIDKQSGQNPLGFGKEFLDFMVLNKTAYLLYSDTVLNGKTRLTLFNTNNKKKEFYEIQNDYWELYIDTLTTKNLKIKYTLDRNGDTTKTKIYSR